MLTKNEKILLVILVILVILIIIYLMVKKENMDASGFSGIECINDICFDNTKENEYKVSCYLPIYNKTMYEDDDDDEIKHSFEIYNITLISKNKEENERLKNYLKLLDKKGVIQYIYLMYTLENINKDVMREITRVHKVERILPKNWNLKIEEDILILTDDKDNKKNLFSQKELLNDGKITRKINTEHIIYMTKTISTKL